MENTMKDIVWENNRPAFGRILAEWSTNCIGRLYGRVRKVRKTVHDWDTSGGCLLITLEECEYNFELFGQTYGGIKCGTKETKEEAQAEVEKAMRLELASIEKHGARW